MHCRKNNTLTYDKIEAYSTASQAAIDDWKATATPLSFSSASSYELRIALGGYGKSGYDGITWTWCGTGVQTDPSNTYYNDYFTAGYSLTARRQVAVHEIGHAMGLDHAGTATCSGQPIMYATSNRYFTCHHVTPQPDDVAGINAIYH